METTLLNRYQLFLEAFKFLSARDFYKAYDDIKEVVNIYKGSYIIINKLESLLSSESKKNKNETFMAWYGDNEYSAREYIDVSYIRKKLHQKIIKI